MSNYLLGVLGTWQLIREACLPIVIEIVVLVHDMVVKDHDKYWGGLE